MKIYDEFSPTAFQDSINKNLLTDIIMEKERRKAERVATDAVGRYSEMNEGCMVRHPNDNNIYKQQ